MDDNKFYVVIRSSGPRKGDSSNIVAWIETTGPVEMDADGPCVTVDGVEINGLHGTITVEMEAPI